MEILRKTTFHFIFKNIDQLEKEFSPEFIFCNVPWKVHIKRLDDFFQIYLYCIKNDITPDWRFFTAVKFRLFQFANDESPNNNMENNFVSNFDHKNMNWGFPKFISWNDLNDPRNKYVRNNIIKLEVELNADPSEIVSMQEEHEISSCVKKEKHFRLTIENISQVVAQVSKQIMVFNFPLELIITKRSGNLQSQAHVYESEDNNENFDHPLLFTKFILISDKKSLEVEIENFAITFEENSSMIKTPYNSIVKLGKLFDPNNGYIKDDSITLDVHIEIKAKHGNESSNGAKRRKISRTISCPICFDDLMKVKTFSTGCGHLYCEKCIENPVKRDEKCSVCNKVVDPTKIHPIFFP